MFDEDLFMLEIHYPNGEVSPDGVLRRCTLFLTEHLEGEIVDMWEDVKQRFLAVAEEVRNRFQMDIDISPDYDYYHNQVSSLNDMMTDCEEFINYGLRERLIDELDKIGFEVRISTILDEIYAFLDDIEEEEVSQSPIPYEIEEVDVIEALIAGAEELPPARPSVLVRSHPSCGRICGNIYTRRIRASYKKNDGKNSLFV